MQRVIVKSRGARFRRAGIEFTRAGVELGAVSLTEEQREAIFFEPNLVMFDPDSEVPERQQIAEFEQARERARAERASGRVQFSADDDGDDALLAEQARREAADLEAATKAEAERAATVETAAEKARQKAAAKAFAKAASNAGPKKAGQ